MDLEKILSENEKREEEGKNFFTIEDYRDPDIEFDEYRDFKSIEKGKLEKRRLKSCKKCDKCAFTGFVWGKSLKKLKDITKDCTDACDDLYDYYGEGVVKECPQKNLQKNRENIKKLVEEKKSEEWKKAGESYDEESYYKEFFDLDDEDFEEKMKNLTVEAANRKIKKDMARAHSFLGCNFNTWLLCDSTEKRLGVEDDEKNYPTGIRIPQALQAEAIEYWEGNYYLTEESIDHYYSKDPENPSNWELLWKEVTGDFPNQDDPIQIGVCEEIDKLRNRSIKNLFENKSKKNIISSYSTDNPQLF